MIVVVAHTTHKRKRTIFCSVCVFWFWELLDLVDLLPEKAFKRVLFGDGSAPLSVGGKGTTVLHFSITFVIVVFVFVFVVVCTIINVTTLVFLCVCYSLTKLCWKKTHKSFWRDDFKVYRHRSYRPIPYFGNPSCQEAPGPLLSFFWAYFRVILLWKCESDTTVPERRERAFAILASFYIAIRRRSAMCSWQ